MRPQDRTILATLSHDLRVPISAIKLSAETLRTGGAKGGKSTLRFLKIIESHADRLTRIVDDLLRDAEAEDGKRKPELLALRPFVKQFIRDTRPLAARRKISIQAVLSEDADVRMAPGRLSRILQNLVDNAIKYNKRRGSVLVRLSRTGGREAQISVLDTGIGIDQHELPLIFGKFYRTEKARALSINGTGLGLSSLKGLVESEGGRIWAESIKDKGSIFHVALPIAKRCR